jgi:hypothetical protein
MLESFRLKVGMSYSRMHFRHSHDPMMNFTDALTRARRALVIIPESYTDNESISTLLHYLQRRYTSEGVMVLIRDDQVSKIRIAPQLPTLTYSANDINTWFVPRRELIEKMKTSAFDVVLDLNVNLSLPSAFLCKASNAPLRVSFAKQEGDQFYNFQIQTKGATNKTNTYRSLLKCLDMF